MRGLMIKAAPRGKYDRSQSAADRAAQRREHLLESATMVFGQRGVAATRVDDIVESAGISRRTLYQDFASLDQILTEVYERAVRMIFRAIAARMLTATHPIERIRVGVAAFFESIAANPAVARVIFDEYRNAGPTQAARYELNTSRFVTLLLETLSAAHASGHLGRLPDEATVYALIKGCEAIGIRAIHRGEHATLSQLAPTMSQLILDAFHKPANSP